MYTKLQVHVCFGIWINFEHKTSRQISSIRYFKKDMKFVPPHAPKEECEKWLKKNLVWGCAKPFKFDGRTVEKCGYI